MPTPPWPELGVLNTEDWNQPLQNTNLAAETSTWVESWSGYALNRTASTVSPWLIPASTTNRNQVDLERGAVRFWYSPAQGSAQAPATATLLTLVSVVGNNTITWWSLVLDHGTNLMFLCPGDTRLQPCLSASVDWAAGSWHSLAVAYSPATNSVLFVDGQRAAIGDGLPAIPSELAPVTCLVVGSDLDGQTVAAGCFDNLSAFTGRKRFHQILNRPFGLTEDWEIGQYWATYSPIAALGPITAEEEASLAQARAQRHAELLAARQAAALDSGMTLSLQEGAGCVTNGPVYMTNAVCSFDTNSGWSLSFDVQGGVLETLYDVFASTNLAGNSVIESQWSWITTTCTCNTVILTNQPSDLGFYILGDTADSDGDGLGIAFELLVSRTDPNAYSSRGDGIDDRTAWLQGRNPRVGGSLADTNGLIALEIFTPLR